MQLPFLLIGALALGVYDKDMIPVLVKSVGIWFAMTIGVVLVKQSSLLYVPFPDPRLPKQSKKNPPGYRAPDEPVYNMKYENLKIQAMDGATIHAWFIKAKPSSAESQEPPEKSPTIIYFHGNAGSIAHRLPLYFELFNKVGPANILAVEYRGYGESDEAYPPSESGLKLDAQAALHWALTHPEHVDPEQIFLFGCSLGGAVAIALASSSFAKKEEVAVGDGAEGNESARNIDANESRIRGIILENTFTSIRDLAFILLPYLKPISFLIRPPLLTNAWSSLDCIDSCNVPILFLSGELDELVPPSHMAALHDKSLGSSPFVMFEKIKGGGHNTTPIVGGDAYYSKINSFMKKVLANEFSNVNNLADLLKSAVEESRVAAPSPAEDYEFVNKED